MSKHQIPNNIQTPIPNDLNEISSNFGHWNFFGIWKLGFGPFAFSKRSKVIWKHRPFTRLLQREVQ